MREALVCACASNSRSRYCRTTSGIKEGLPVVVRMGQPMRGGTGSGEERAHVL